VVGAVVGDGLASDDAPWLAIVNRGADGQILDRPNALIAAHCTTSRPGRIGPGSCRTGPVSAGLLANTDAYFEALGSYRQGDPAPTFEQLSSAAVLAVVNGRHLVGNLRSMREPTTDPSDLALAGPPAMSIGMFDGWLSTPRFSTSQSNRCH
jgi:hypothetical protein